MTPQTPQDWRKDFGLEARQPPFFFSSIEELDDSAGVIPQPNALRRAFEQLEIDGVLCQERSPVIYFRQVNRIEPTEIADIHRRFWNQGVAPILVLITSNEVHIYSGLIAPGHDPTSLDEPAGFVQTISRIESALRSFILSVESGEYFHVHRKSFDPRQRVDRRLLRNLQAARERLAEVETTRLEPQTLDALLCRLVFTCYLFDRGVIDQDYLKSLHISGASHLNDILAKKPKSDAKAALYRLFDQLGKDFNGDLFSDDLEAESRQVRVEHLDIIDRFFHAADVHSGQESFLHYDFGIIPIETISAIYEHFLKASGEHEKKESGAFYTPRFLAEFVLDVALEGETSLLDKRFLDPACGSGIFLVGLFNRLAEEWKLKNRGARYDRRANGLLKILRNNLYGVDFNRTACRITAFSLYLALLDQLSPPDIRQLQRKGKFLPHLVSVPGEVDENAPTATIRCADFFTDAANSSNKVHIIIGNPPWGSAKDRKAPAVAWCAAQDLPHPDRQMATAFLWKAPTRLEDRGKVCFVLPYGTLFNHHDAALRFQQRFVRAHAVERVVNLTDYQRFLFEESEAPAIIMRYTAAKPRDTAHRIDYWSPKTDWTITQAEVIAISPQDRTAFTVGEVLSNLSTQGAPLIWKQRHWATSRDLRFLSRLSLMPSLRDHVRQPREPKTTKPWIIAEGCQPIGPSDDPSKGEDLALPGSCFIPARSKSIDLVLIESDCTQLPEPSLHVRSGSNKVVDVFRAPHVLINHGFTKVAFASFPVAFFDSIRGIHGPSKDKDLLAFLTAYLRSPLAKYFQFHTSSTWGVGKQVVDSIDLLRTPFPLPDQVDDSTRGQTIVRQVAALVHKVQTKLDPAAFSLHDRRQIVDDAQRTADSLIYEYFDINEVEQMLIRDTVEIIIPSVRPSRAKPDVPTVRHSDDARLAAYTKLLCATLNDWARKEYTVHAETIADASVGIGMVVLEKNKKGQSPTKRPANSGQLLQAIDQLQRSVAKHHGTFDLVRGLKVFQKNCLFISKPLGQRFWTNTAALNDADEIAATVLMRPAREAV